MQINICIHKMEQSLLWAIAIMWLLLVLYINNSKSITKDNKNLFWSLSWVPVTILFYMQNKK